jgi:hypothetical protein
MTMKDEIYSIYHLSIVPANFDAFKALVEQIVEATSKEPDTTTYEYVVNADRTVVHIVERYRTIRLWRHDARNPGEARRIWGRLFDAIRGLFALKLCQSAVRRASTTAGSVVGAGLFALIGTPALAQVAIPSPCAALAREALPGGRV